MKRTIFLISNNFIKFFVTVCTFNRIFENIWAADVPFEEFEKRCYKHVSDRWKWMKYNLFNLKQFCVRCKKYVCNKRSNNICSTVDPPYPCRVPPSSGGRETRGLGLTLHLGENRSRVFMSLGFGKHKKPLSRRNEIRRQRSYISLHRVPFRLRSLLYDSDNNCPSTTIGVNILSRRVPIPPSALSV